jgi:hypothetical protein
MERFACGYCGNEQIVRREGGVVMLAPVVEGLRHVQTGVDKTAAELALVRLAKEIAMQEAVVKQIERTPFYQAYPPTWIESLYIYVLVGCLFVGTIAFSARNLPLVSICIIVVIAYTVYWQRLNSTRIAAGRVDLKERLAAEQRKLAHLRAQLKHNQELVGR